MTKRPIRIIVCGCDKTGKTEIAKELARRLEVPYFKARNEKANFRTAQDRFLNELLWADPRQVDIIDQLNLSVVFDRAYPCERAYSMVLNRRTDHEALQAIDHAYARLGTKVIVCHRSSYEGLVDEDAPTVLTPNVLKVLEEAYRDFMRWTQCASYLLNVDDEDLDREVNEIMTWASVVDI